MAGTKIEITGIENLQVKSKLKEVQIAGSEKGDKETVLMTTVSFDYDGAAGKMDLIMHALLAGHKVDVVLNSPQSSMDIIISRGESVTARAK